MAHSLSFFAILLVLTLPFSTAQGIPPIFVGTPPISVGVPPISVTTPPISVSTPPVSVSLLPSILGKVVCDKCWDGASSESQNDPVSGAQVDASCTVQTSSGAIFVTASGTTSSDGTFALGLDASATSDFLSALYVGGLPTNGVQAGSALTGCTLSVTSSTCPTLTLNDGICVAGPVQGNGYTSGVSLVNIGSTSADISITADICTSPLSVDPTCAAVSTPPISVGTPPISVGVPPISVTTPPISVSTPPVSVSLLPSILGKVVCDKCWDGTSSASENDPASGAQITASCSFETSSGSTDVSASGTTSSDGTFSLALDASSSSTFLSTLFVGGVPTSGLVTGGALTGCTLSVTSSTCPTLTLDSGICLSGGVQGNGFTSGVSLVNIGSTSADISISTDVCTAPLSIDPICATVSTPPIFVGTPPISVGVPPISVTTPPISVSTPPVSVSLLPSILGKVVCDKCWDGTSSASENDPVSGAQITASCSFETSSGSTDVSASGTTSSDGTFSLALDVSASTTFLSSLFVGGIPTNGLVAGGALTGCTLSVTSSTCPTLTLDSGVCLSGGVQGNGYTSGVSLVNIGSTSADISISTDVCTTPLSVDPSCLTSLSVPGVTGDPHYTGADGSRFDFSGAPGSTYCLISDKHLHINVFYGGRFDQWGDNPHKALTWIRQMAILWSAHTVTFAARSGARWQYDNGYMARMEINGQEFTLAQEGDSFEGAGGAIKVSWIGAKVQSADDLIDIYELEIKGVMKMRMYLRAEIALLRTETDGLVHFDFDLPASSLSDEAHGILGQTFRRDHRDRLAKQKLEFSALFHALVVPGDDAEGFIDGSAADYVSSSLLSTDCRFNRFTGAASRDVTSTQAVELASAKGQNIIGKILIGRKMGQLII